MTTAGATRALNALTMPVMRAARDALMVGVVVLIICACVLPNPSTGLPCVSNDDCSTDLACRLTLDDGGVCVPARILCANGVSVSIDGSCTTLASAPRLREPRSLHTATLLLDGRVVIAGGLGAGGALASVEIIDVANGISTVVAPLLHARAGHTATSVDGRVVVAGGFDRTSVLASAEAYDPVLDTWTELDSMSCARAGHAAFHSAGIGVIVAGGADEGGSIGCTEVLVTLGGPWRRVGDLNVARDSASAVESTGTAPLLIGGARITAGAADVEAVDVVEAFDEALETWREVAPLAQPRFASGAAILDGDRVLVAGGTAGLDYLDSVEIYDVASDKWTEGPSLPHAAMYASVTAVRGGALIVGGTDDVRSFDEVSLFLDGPELLVLAARLDVAADSQTATKMSSGELLLAGGSSTLAGTFISLADAVIVKRMCAEDDDCR